MEETSGYLRVTDIIKPFSGIEFVPRYILDPAAELGTKVHKAIEEKIQGFGGDLIDLEVQPYLDSFDAFWEGSKHAWKEGKIEIEKRLFCEISKFTGMIDAIISTKDKTYLFDWKTSKSEQKKSWRLQAAAYKYLASSNGYENIGDLVFVKLKKDGKKAILYSYTSYSEDIEIFFECLKLYKHFEMDKTRGR